MRILGRSSFIAALARQAHDGHAVLAYGPRGIGASTVLDGCAAVLARSRRCIVRIARLATYADLIEPLARAYLGVPRAPLFRLNAAVEAKPGALLVDRVEHVGPKARRALRELSAVGLGAILVGAADASREHVALRAMRVAHREVEIPPLDRGAMRAIFDAELGEALAVRLVDPDRERALSAAAGRPGLIASIARALADPRYWRGERAAIDLALADLALADAAALKGTSS